MTTTQQILSDIEFARGSGEFGSIAAVLRYVAAINYEVTLGEFVGACVEAGFRANTAANRFRESRKLAAEIDAEMALSDLNNA